IVSDAQGRMDEAEVQYETALALAAELNDRRSQGQFNGYLGWLCARVGRFDRARACLAVGEALLEAVGDRLSLGMLLCSLAKTEQLAGESAAASAAIARAERLAIDAGAAPDSELRRELSALRGNGRLEPDVAHVSRC